MTNHTGQRSTPQKNQELDLEIKDAQLIFNSVWNELVSDKGGVEHLNFPREMFWLNGAPGSGKGTQTSFIMEYCGLTAQPIVVSELLNSPEAKRLKDAGMMVGDREVTSLLLRELLRPERQTGVIVDGFPRTKVQVESLKLFYQRLMDLRRQFLGTKLSNQFPKPIFHIVVLYVDEAVSVHRQLSRGRKAMETAERARTAGEDNVQSSEVRKTDLSVDLARNRYRTFKEITYESLASLREIFHYHFINAQQSIAEVQRNIVRELKYQSTLELEERTYDMIAQIPVADSITVHARQDLVTRLDDYALLHSELFRQVITMIEDKVMPVVLKHAISGQATIFSEDPVFEDPLALTMFLDIFSERGYRAVANVQHEEIPNRIDLETGKIYTRRKTVYRFTLYFEGSVIRRGH
ncbi:MAG: nucleoside monophosphate kinase [Verrucomicrobiota bacterium JB022]|nr:nucleoside monophosphate kinase [Verrucomicrobiota bacterium JB022]